MPRHAFSTPFKRDGGGPLTDMYRVIPRTEPERRAAALPDEDTPPLQEEEEECGALPTVESQNEEKELRALAVQAIKPLVKRQKTLLSTITPKPPSALPKKAVTVQAKKPLSKREYVSQREAAMSSTEKEVLSSVLYWIDASQKVLAALQRRQECPIMELLTALHIDPADVWYSPDSEEFTSP